MPKTKQTRRRNGSLCPACERYIGPAGSCPYCGTGTGRPTSLKVLKWGAAALAGVGLVFLYLMSLHRDVPQVTIAEISALMNFATVRIAGTVDRQPYVSTRDGAVDYVSFVIDDGTGSLRVSAEREVARALSACERVPREGQFVAVTGRLSVRADGKRRLRVQTADRVSIRPGSGSRET